MPDAAMIPSLLTLSDVMATGWHAAVAAGVREGGTAVVVGDGAVGLCGVLAAVADGRRAGDRDVAPRAAPGDRPRSSARPTSSPSAARRATSAIKELTGGVGADAVLECVGTDAAMKHRVRGRPPGSTVGFVGVPARRRAAGPPDVPEERRPGRRDGAGARATCPSCSSCVLDGAIDPGLVFDLTLPLDEVAEGYRAMDERRAIKVLLEP